MSESSVVGGLVEFGGEVVLGRCQYVGGGRRCESEVMVPGGYYCEKHLARVNEVPRVAVKAGFLPADLKSRYYGAADDVLRNLEESIEIQKVLESLVLERISGAGSFQAWKVLEEELKKGDDEVDLERLREIVSLRVRQDHEALGMYEVIGKLHEGQRKLTETLMKCRGDLEKSFTKEQWNRLMFSVIEVLRARVDVALLNELANELALLTAKHVNTVAGGGMVKRG